MCCRRLPRNVTKKSRSTSRTTLGTIMSSVSGSEGGSNRLGVFPLSSQLPVIIPHCISHIYYKEGRNGRYHKQAPTCPRVVPFSLVLASTLPGGGVPQTGPRMISSTNIWLPPCPSQGWCLTLIPTFPKGGVLWVSLRVSIPDTCKMHLHVFICSCEFTVCPGAC